MKEVFLISETFIKEQTNLSDNLSSKLILPAIREAQEISLRTILGDALIDKLKLLVKENTILEPENAKYKTLIDNCQFYLAYEVASNISLLTAVKIDNLGVSRLSDDNVDPVEIDDVILIKDYYEKKADFYAKRIQQYLQNHYSDFPELNCCQNGINPNLTSASSTNIWLGGARGRYLNSAKNCSNSGSATSNNDYNKLLSLIADKQDILVSGENIKTVNGKSLLGAGNISIEAGGESYDDSEIRNEISNLKTNKLDVSTYNSDKSNFATKSEIPDVSNLATKDEIPSLDGYLTEVEGDAKYQAKGNYISSTEADEKYQLKGDYITSEQADGKYQPIGDYATKSEIPDVSNLATKDEIPSLDGYLKETSADEKYQVKGDYALKSDIPSTDDFATKTELQSKQDTLVSGTNIKTINGTSILGEGNIIIDGGTGTGYDDTEIRQEISELKTNKLDVSTYNSDKSNFATKDEIPSLDGYLKETSADEKYQAKGNYVTSEQADGKYQPIGDYATKSEIPNISNLATKAELANKLDVSTYNADKATFALKTEIPSTDDFATKTELQSKQDTLVSGTNIKTINGTPILGEGNIIIDGGTGTGYDDTEIRNEINSLKTNKLDVSTYTTDKSNFATKDEIPSLDGYLTEIAGDAKYQAKGEYALKSEIPDVSNLATKTELANKLDTSTYNEDKATFALKTEIPSVDNFATKDELNLKLDSSAAAETYITKTDASNTYQTKGNYISSEQADEKYQLKGNYATKDEIPSLDGYLTEVAGDAKYQAKGNYISSTEADEKYQLKGDYITSEQADLKYQPIGDYATKSEIPDVSNLATKAELANKLDTSTYNEDKATFALKTEIPSTDDFVTKEDAATTYATKANLNTKANKITVKNVSGTSVTQELTANTYYVFGTVYSLTITLKAETASQYNEYLFEFVSGSTPTVLKLPETIKLPKGVELKIEANTTYEMSIVNNRLKFTAF